MLHPLDEITPVVSKPTGTTHTFPLSPVSRWMNNHHVLTRFCVCVFFPGLFEGSRVQYASDATMKIVFTCCQPSVVVSYDTVQGIHSVWILRKVTPDVSDHTDTHTQTQRVYLSLTSSLLPPSGAFLSPALCSWSSWHTLRSDGIWLPDLSPP